MSAPRRPGAGAPTAVVFLGLVVGLLGPSVGGAADPRERLRFRRYGEAEGLEAPSVRSLLQDRAGFLWVGTTEGLFRFDGSDFERFPLVSPPASDPAVFALLEDERPGIWVGTGEGIARLDPDTHAVSWVEPRPGTGPDTLAVHDLARDDDGTLWAATHRGLCRIEPSDLLASCRRHDPADPSSPGSDDLAELEPSRSGAVWIATADSGLDRCDPASGRCEHLRHDPDDPDTLASDLLNAVHEDTRGRVWVGTYGDGLDRLDPADPRWRHYPYHPGDPTGPSGRGIKAIREDRSGRIWLGTWGGGVNLLDPATDRILHARHHPDIADSVSDDRVLALLEDDLGRVWVGTYYGLDVHDSSREVFEVYRNDADDPSSLRDERVLSVLEDHRGRLWIGTYHRGLTRIDLETGTTRHYEPDPSDPRALSNSGVWALLEDDGGTVWAGTSGGLHRYLEETEGWERMQAELGDPAPFSNNNVLSLAEDPSGALWLGTWAGSLDRFDPDTGEVEQLLPDPDDPSALAGDPIRALVVDPTGRLWIGTSGGGLAALDPDGGFRRFTHDAGTPGSLSDDTVTELLVTGDGVLWVATPAGLDRWRPREEAFERVLGDEVEIHGLARDDLGRLWLGTADGVTCADPSTGDLVSYDQADGLQSHTAHLGGTERGPSGRIYVAGESGLTAFDPRRLPLERRPPRVALTAFRLLNRVVAVGEDGPLARDVASVGEIVLEPEQYSFGFEFAAVLPRQPEKVRYAYQLEGLDPAWVEAGADERRATYTGLPPGRYTFRVRAGTAAGWGPEPAAVTVVLLPPWWRTRWFLTLVAAAALGAVLGLFRWRTGALERRTHLLEELVAERTRELEEASLTDPLTDLRNRRFVSRHLAGDVERTLRAYGSSGDGPPTGQDLLFALLDLDRFKELNDRHGHAAGDTVLQQAAEVLRREARGSDVVVRWGGEEFLVVGREAERWSAFTTGDRLRRAIAAEQFTLGTGEVVPVTASIGVAVFPADPTRPEALGWEQVLHLADAALYAAKVAGRDTTIAVAPAPGADLPSLHARIGTELDRLEAEGALVVDRS